MIRIAVGVTLLAMASAASAQESELLLCEVVENDPWEANFEVGDRFILSYGKSGEAKATMRWVTDNGYGNQVECKVNGPFLNCLLWDHLTFIYDRPNKTFHTPRVVGDDTAKSSCKPLDLYALP